MATAGIDRVLGIETSCDETAAAVVDGGEVIASSVVSSQIDLHARYGGVVPELAGRAHVELLTPVLAEALELAGSDTSGRGIDAIAVTYGPGLIGSLLVGVAEAKALALAWDVPLVGVNHLEAHLFASLLEQPDLGWPLVVLLVSGGHTLVIEVTEPGRYRLLGGTIDDAAGEAFDKVARFLGLGYPGGPAIDRIADQGDPTAFAFPRSLPGDGYDFSFSGLKTSVVTTVRKHPSASTADVAASFRQAVPVAPPPTPGPPRCAWPAGWRPTRCCAAGSRRSAPRTGSAPSCPAGPCARTTRPWWPQRGGGASSRGSRACWTWAPTRTCAWCPPPELRRDGPHRGEKLALVPAGCQTPRIPVSLALSTLDC
jgi:N6-L-threonylcarbamoyladenine synthase